MDKIKNESRRKRETVSVKKETIMLDITEKKTCPDMDMYLQRMIHERLPKIIMQRVAAEQNI
jgi:hypothetical protein